MNPDESPIAPSEGSPGDNRNAPIVPGNEQPQTPSPVSPTPTSPQVVPPEFNSTSVPTQPAPTLTPTEQTPHPAILSELGNYAPQGSAGAPEAPQAGGSVPNSPVSGGFGDNNGGQSITPPSTSSSPLKPARKQFSKSLLIVLAVVIVLVGGSVAAYVGIVVPNEPQNVLKSAIVNSLHQTQLSLNGNVQLTTSSLAGKLTFSSESNTVSKDTDLQMTLTISGISFPVEVRLVDSNIYFKLGDVSSIVSLIDSLSPQDASVVSSLAAELSNQWYVVDSTLIDESSEAKCLLNTNLSVSNDDVQQLESLYSKNEFVTIQSTSSAVLNGANTERMNLVVNNTKADNFANSLSGLSLVKQLNSCSSTTDSTLSKTTNKGSTGNTDISVWVNKSTKRIVQIGGSSKSSSSDKYTYQVGISYNPVNISAPANAKPVADLLTALKSSSL